MLQLPKEDCFHLGVKALIHNEKGKILLLEKNPKNKAGRCWDIPGGRIGKSEPLEDALRREVYEETGLQHLTEVQFFTMVLTDMRISVPHGDVGLLLAVYLCRAIEDTNIILSDEHIHFDWFDPKGICNLVSPYFPQELIEKILNGR